MCAARARGESEELGAGPLLPRGTLWTLNGAHAAPCFPHPVLVPPWAGGPVKALSARGERLRLGLRSQACIQTRTPPLDLRNSASLALIFFPS